MKNILLTLILSQLGNGIFAQNSREFFSKMVAIPVSREKLEKCQKINDAIPGCPTHWDEIIQLVSTNIEGYQTGKKSQVEAAGIFLSEKQKLLLKTSDLGAAISIKVKFKWKDTTSVIGDYGGLLEMNEFRLVVVPAVEAEFPGGAQMLSQYLKDSVFNYVPGEKNTRSGWREEGVFTVDEKGKIVNINLVRSSGNDEIDKLFLKALGQMPDWTPARNTDGSAVKQVFQFNLFVPNKSRIPGKADSGC